MTEVELNRSLHTGAMNLVARRTIAVGNLLLATVSAVFLFWAAIYLFGSLTDSLSKFDATVFSLLAMNLVSLAALIFSTMTAVGALRKKQWWLKTEIAVSGRHCSGSDPDGTAKNLVPMKKRGKK